MGNLWSYGQSEPVSKSKEPARAPESKARATPPSGSNSPTTAPPTPPVGMQQQQSDALSEDYKPGWLERKCDKFRACMKKYKRELGTCALILFFILSGVYFYFAYDFWLKYTNQELKLCQGFGCLIALYVIVYFAILCCIIRACMGRWLKENIFEKLNNAVNGMSSKRYFTLVSYCILSIIFGIFIYFDTRGPQAFERLITLAALALLIFLGFIFSTHPSRVNWRIVLSGLTLQIIMGLISIRWPTGRMAIKCLSDQISTFLNYGLDGAAFAYGDNLVRGESVFAFAALPTIYFFSMMVEIAIYYGILQSCVTALGRVLRYFTHATICEGVICVGNVFLGMTESMFLIKPYLNLLTPSELHLVVSSGFGTVSGYLLTIYIVFGANPAHLVTASVMSAPAAICYAKLLMPETKRSLATAETMLKAKSEEKSVLSAATRGAAAAIMLILNIIAMLVAIVAFISLINGLLTFFGDLIGLNNLKLEFILGKCFMPLCYIMGVPWAECEYVGALIGIKTMVNEFVAYQRLGEMKKEGLLSSRSELIATYSLCGFANPCSIGIMVGAMSAIAPEQKENVSKVVIRAFFTGCGICFMTASIADGVNYVYSCS